MNYTKLKKSELIEALKLAQADVRIASGYWAEHKGKYEKMILELIDKLTEEEALSSELQQVHDNNIAEYSDNALDDANSIINDLNVEIVSLKKALTSLQKKSKSDAEVYEKLNRDLDDTIDNYIDEFRVELNQLKRVIIQQAIVINDK